MANEVGRELDIEIARALGWRSIGQWDHIDDKGDMVADDDDWVGVSPDAKPVSLLPHWSTSDADAVALLAEATRRGWTWHVDYGGPGYEIVVLMQGPLGGAAVQQAKGFAEAVSRAFVAAHEAEQKEQPPA